MAEGAFHGQCEVLLKEAESFIVNACDASVFQTVVWDCCHPFALLKVLHYKEMIEVLRRRNRKVIPDVHVLVYLDDR